MVEARKNVLEGREEVLNADSERLEALLHEVSALLYRNAGIVRQATHVPCFSESLMKLASLSLASRACQAWRSQVKEKSKDRAARVSTFVNW